MILLSQNPKSHKKNHHTRLITATLDGATGNITVNRQTKKHQSEKQNKQKITTTKTTIEMSRSLVFPPTNYHRHEVNVCTTNVKLGWSDFPCVYVDPPKFKCHEVEMIESTTLPIHQHHETSLTHKRMMTKTHILTTAATTKKQRHGRPKKVQFNSVHIREHSITIGDHDWCDGTLPLTLDWSHAESIKSMRIDDYENLRERQGRAPRGRLPRLDYWHRKQLLQRVGGISKEDIELLEYMEQGKVPSKYIRLQRTRTVTVFPKLS
jgi:hypothetical protein